jgi:predicted PurR-regulated permease PerM
MHKFTSSVFYIGVNKLYRLLTICRAIAVSILVILVAVVAGGVAFLLGYRAQQQQEFREIRTPDSATRKD